MKYFWPIIPLLISLSCLAGIDLYHFENREQEAIYKELVEQLRCLVCQNQNVADSNAELAQDLRQKTYEMVVSGSSKEEIYTYMVERYGDFVLYQPPVKKSTLILWIGPFVFLLIGLGTMIRIIRLRALQNSGELSEADLDRVEKMLDREDSKS